MLWKERGRRKDWKMRCRSKWRKGRARTCEFFRPQQRCWSLLSEIRSCYEVLARSDRSDCCTLDGVSLKR